MPKARGKRRTDGKTTRSPACILVRRTYDTRTRGATRRPIGRFGGKSVFSARASALRCNRRGSAPFSSSRISCPALMHQRQAIESGEDLHAVEFLELPVERSVDEF